MDRVKLIVVILLIIMIMLLIYWLATPSKKERDPIPEKECYFDSDCCGSQICDCGKCVDVPCNPSQTGTPDSTFGSGGVARGEFTEVEDLPEIVRNGMRSSKIVQQSDGKYVMCGEYFSFNQTRRIYAMRRNTNGSLDTSYGTGGVYIGPDMSIGSDCALQSDGKLIIGYRSPSDEIVFTRLNTDGTLDTSFGTAGETSVPPIDTFMIFGDIEIDSQDRIVFAGSSGVSLGPISYLVMRLTANGTLDGSFGTGGIVTGLPPTATDARLWGLELDASGRVVVVGIVRFGGPLGQLLVMRFLTGGSLDTGFGTSGYTSFDITTTGIPFDNSLQGWDLTQHPDGSWAILANPGTEDAKFYVLHMSNTGEIDLEYGNYDGVYRFEIDEQSVSGDTGEIIGFCDNSVVVCGSNYGLFEGSDSSAIIFKVDPEGNLDTSFGNDGYVETVTVGSPGSYDVVEVQSNEWSSLLEDQQNRIVTSGYEFLELDVPFNTNLFNSLEGRFL